MSIGGGTGLSALLHGLKQHVPHFTGHPEPSGHFISDLAAVVTVTDDGGSSGRLRRELRVLPPGDIRNCMVALSEDEALMSRLFQYRFQRGKGLTGHSFGNLFLAALTRVTGDFVEAVKLSSEVLKICGRIYPSTASNVTLEADMADGRRVRGETRITKTNGGIRRIRLVPGDCQPLPETLKALAEADVITLGPGSLFTSLVPNVLVKGVVEAMVASKAVKIYVGNLMTQPGESLDMTASQHVQVIYRHAGAKLFDYAVLNSGRISDSLLKRYRKQRAQPVINDLPAIEALEIRPLLADLVSEDGYVRHDPARLARVVLRVASRQPLTAAAG